MNTKKTTSSLAGKYYRNALLRWVVSGIFYGFIMFLFFEFLFPWASKEPFDEVQQLGFKFLFWLAFGAISELIIGFLVNKLLPKRK